ncbi:MAG: hypothetical protein WBG86_14160 [Polyangiales bacterium]
MNSPRDSRPGVRHRLFVVSTTLVVLAALLFFLCWPLEEIDSGRSRSYPQLFVGAAACPTLGDPGLLGSRAEHSATYRAYRYPYDPTDGVTAVQAYKVASSCYRSYGSDADASRARGEAIELMTRVSTDYAAARLGLMRAFESERWDDVIREVRHLQLLTSHLGEHEYVEWLRKIEGKAVAMQSTRP